MSLFISCLFLCTIGIIVLLITVLQKLKVKKNENRDKYSAFERSLSHASEYISQNSNTQQKLKSLSQPKRLRIRFRSLLPLSYVLEEY